MAFYNSKFANALFGTPTIDYGADIQAYRDELAKQQEFQNLAQRNNLTLDQALSGVMQGRNYGDKNIAQKQQELGINVPQTKEEIALADNGLFNKYNTTRQGGVINDLIGGFQENATQGFNVNNLAPVQGKGLATRLGEGLGTLARFYDKPIGRMAVATGLSMLTGETNPLNEGIKAYVGRQNNITQDRVYRNQLKQLGMTDDEVNAIPGNVTKDVFDGVTSAMRLGNQRMTYGQLAMLDDDIAEEVRKNPSLANQFVPVNIARDIYTKKRPMAESKMAEIAAKTKKTEAETKQVGKPKVTINRKEGTTTSNVNIVHSSGSGKGSDRPKKHKTNAF